MKWLVLVCVASVGCQGEVVPGRPPRSPARAYPRFSSQPAPPLPAQEGVEPAGVMLTFPRVEVNDILHWGGGNWGTPTHFRIVIPATPNNLRVRIRDGQEVGSIRSRDRALSEGEFHALRCAYGHAWDDEGKYGPGFMRPLCTRTSAEARLSSIAIVDAVLDDIREGAASAGSWHVRDVRCYAGANSHRLWCEGTAVSTAR